MVSTSCPHKLTNDVSPPQDMHLFFSNIYTYNGTNSNFGKLGSRVEGLFEVLRLTTSLGVLPTRAASRSFPLAGAFLPLFVA